MGTKPPVLKWDKPSVLKWDKTKDLKLYRWRVLKWDKTTICNYIDRQFYQSSQKKTHGLIVDNEQLNYQ